MPKNNPEPEKQETVHETIARFRAQNQAKSQQSQEIQSVSLENVVIPNIQRVARKHKELSYQEKKNMINHITKQLLCNRLTQGQAIKALRLNVFQLNQTDYARVAKISRKTLSLIENDSSGFTTDVLNLAFKPFGLKIGIVPISEDRLAEIFK